MKLFHLSSRRFNDRDNILMNKRKLMSFVRLVHQSLLLQVTLKVLTLSINVVKVTTFTVKVTIKLNLAS